MSAQASLNAPGPVEQIHKAVAAHTQAMADRNALVEGLAALFGITADDARMIERDFRNNPQHRRSPDLHKHCALTLRARERFLAPRRKAVAA